MEQTKNSLCRCDSGKKFKRCYANSESKQIEAKKVRSLPEVEKENKTLRIEIRAFKELIRILYIKVPETRNIIDSIILHYSSRN